MLCTSGLWMTSRLCAVDDASSAAAAEGGEDRAVDVDCVMCLGVAFHELQLIRVEQHRHPQHHAAAAAAAGLTRGRTGNQSTTGADDDRRSLLLGDIHTDPAQRTLYRPMGFQSALVPHQVN